MNAHSQRVSGMLIAASLLLSGTALADDPSTDEARRKVEQRLLALVRGEAEAYEFRGDEEQDSSAFERREIMKWVNPVRHDQVGVVFLWLRDGRPEAIGTFFTGEVAVGRISVNHEFHSLSTRGLVVRHETEGRRRWNPPTPGVPFHPLAGIQPAASRTGRLLQMRQLARTFSAHSVDREASRWALRLLPKPVHRYAEGTSGAIDGTTFAFVSSAGTDPEVILTLEARDTQGVTGWYWSAARFSDQKLFLRRGEEVVWSFENGGTTDPYVEASPTDRYRLLVDREVESRTLTTIPKVTPESR